MSNLLLGGSLAAAFGAGMVAFFAPCCSSVMLPAYLAAVGGGRRLRIARLTAVYVAGVSTVVLPITLGAAALASYVSHWHAQLFVFGGLMMTGVAIWLWRGTMLSIHIPQPKLSGSALSVFLLGAFSGAATSCCAPVLAGALALSATSGTVTGGIVLGVAYVFGMIAPLVPVALVYRRVRYRVKDPSVTLRIGGRSRQIGAFRLAGASIFAAFGVLYVALGVTGRSQSAPGFQKAMGVWMRELAGYVGHVPNAASFPILVAVIAAFVLAVVRNRGARDEQQQSEAGLPSVGTVAGEEEQEQLSSRSTSRESELRVEHAEKAGSRERSLLEAREPAL
jgi:cytochrome c biogenesis protein CcdA